MSIFDIIKSKFKKSDDTPAFRRAFAERINNRPVRYVTERFNGIEEVVGRGGHINILPNGEELAVTCGIEEIFRARIDSLTMGELMSRDGVVLSGFDLASGREREIIAFYVYYR